MAKEKLNVRDFIARQDTTANTLLATIESTPDSQRVKLTPWSADTGCLCALGFEVAVDAIEAVIQTDHTHACCGKRLIRESGRPTPLSEQRHTTDVAMLGRRTILRNDERGPRTSESSRQSFTTRSRLNQKERSQ